MKPLILRQGESFAQYLNGCCADIHQLNKTWWHHPRTGKRLKRNRPEMMMLIVSEVAEAMEGYRKGLMDDKLPHRPAEEVEMADAVIRIMDYCHGHGLDLGGAIIEKLEYNLIRPDHKPENRRKKGGKKF